MIDKQQIVDEVYSELSSSQETIKVFLDITDKDRLIQFHHSLGRHIRNNYELWIGSWEPDIGDDGCDYSPNHPDSISQSIIEAVWEKLQSNFEVIENGVRPRE